VPKQKRTYCRQFYLTLLISSFLLFCKTSHAQYVPSPIGGWDSLKKAIGYPDLARRAGLGGVSVVKVWVDATGTVDSVKVQDVWNEVDLFDHAVVKAIRSFRWEDGNWGNTKKPFVIPVVFTITNAQIHLPIQIEAESPPVKATKTY